MAVPCKLVGGGGGGGLGELAGRTRPSGLGRGAKSNEGINPSTASEPIRGGREESKRSGGNWGGRGGRGEGHAGGSLPLRIESD